MILYIYISCRSEIFQRKVFCYIFPENIWTKDSSKNGIFLYIFIYLYLNIFASSHHYIFTNSHLHIFASSYLHILTSSSSHLLIFTSSHLLIFTSSHLHNFWHLLSLSRSSPSHLHIFLPSQTNIFTCSYFLIFISSLCRFPSLSRPLLRSLSFFFFSFLRPQAISTRHHDMITLLHETRFEWQKLK